MSKRARGSITFSDLALEVSQCHFCYVGQNNPRLPRLREGRTSVPCTSGWRSGKVLKELLQTVVLENVSCSTGDWGWIRAACARWRGLHSLEEEGLAFIFIISL
jgi:hypothetical protein